MIGDLPYTLYNFKTKRWDSLADPAGMSYDQAILYCPEDEKQNLIILVQSGDSPWLALLLSLQAAT